MDTQKRNMITTPRIEEIRRKRKKQNRILVLIYFVLFVGIIIGFSYLSLYKKINIQNIEINGTRIIDNQKVESLVRENMSGRYLRLFSKSNSFIFPKKKITKNLEQTFTRIDKLDVSLKGLDTLVIDIEERTGSYLWCGSKMPEDLQDSGDNCYFINIDGYIFDKAPYFSGNIYLKFFIPIENPNDPLGKQILSENNFPQIISFVDGLEELGISPVALDMNNEIEYIFYLKNNSNTLPKLLWNKENNLPLIFSNLSAALSKDEFRNELFSKLDTLLYIDLRFDNKVLYKFQ